MENRSELIIYYVSSFVLQLSFKHERWESEREKGNESLVMSTVLELQNEWFLTFSNMMRQNARNFGRSYTRFWLGMWPFLITKYQFTWFTRFLGIARASSSMRVTERKMPVAHVPLWPLSSNSGRNVINQVILTTRKCFFKGSKTQNISSISVKELKKKKEKNIALNIDELQVSWMLPVAMIPEQQVLHEKITIR